MSLIRYCRSRAHKIGVLICMVSPGVRKWALGNCLGGKVMALMQLVFSNNHILKIKGGWSLQVSKAMLIHKQQVLETLKAYYHSTYPQEGNKEFLTLIEAIDALPCTTDPQEGLPNGWLQEASKGANAISDLLAILRKALPNARVIEIPSKTGRMYKLLDGEEEIFPCHKNKRGTGEEELKRAMMGVLIGMKLCTSKR